MPTVQGRDVHSHFAEQRAEHPGASCHGGSQQSLALSRPPPLQKPRKQHTLSSSSVVSPPKLPQAAMARSKALLSPIYMQLQASPFRLGVS